MNGSRQLAFAFEHRPSLPGDDFLVTPSNREAVAWLDAWPAWPAPLLVIHGPNGSGKSHLGQVYRARTGALAVSVAALRDSPPADLLGGAAEVLIRAGQEQGDASLVDFGRKLTVYMLADAARENVPLGRLMGQDLTRLHPAVALLANGGGGTPDEGG